MSSTKERLIEAVRVIPDIDGISQEFDYLVPEDWNASGESKFIQVGTIVRIRFRNRIVRGWVSEINPTDKPNVELIPLKKISGIGPSPEVVNLAKWAAKNWHGKDWIVGAQGGTIVGTRSAAFATIKDLAAILVIDEHDDAYRNEAAPTWNARDVVLQRAKIIGIPIVFTSPILSPEVRKGIQTTETKDGETKTGWGKIRVLDPKQSEGKEHGLWPSGVIDQMKNSERSIVILNRKGRSKLLVCASCGEIVICSECNSKMSQPNEDYLTCSRNHRRPIVCSFCLSTKLKNLRIGIGRAKEELEALLQEPVQEIHANSNDVNLHNGKYLLGTNAALHRVDWADLIFFADYDQELYAGGYRSEETALSNLIRAVRITNTRSRASGQVLIQTRSHKSELLGLIKTGEFSSWSELNQRRRKLLSLPPYGSYAEVSGPGAKKYVERIDVIEGIEVLGPLEGSWLIKSDSHSLLLETLSKVDRPKERVRVAINS